MGGRLSKRKDRRRRGNVGTKPTSGEKCYDPKDRTLTFVDGEDELDCKYNLTFHIPFTIHFLLLLSFIFFTHLTYSCILFLVCFSQFCVSATSLAEQRCQAAVMLSLRCLSPIIVAGCWTRYDVQMFAPSP